MLLIIFFNFGWSSETLQQGIQLFNNQHYSEALAVFQETELAEKEPLGFLIGQLFCQIALHQFAEIDSTLRLIELRLHSYSLCAQSSSQAPSRGHSPPPSPPPLTQDQQLMLYQCRRHIREVANQMRHTVEKLVRESVPGIFKKIKVLRQLYPFIDALEQTGIECCQGNYPLGSCLDPLLEQLEAWKTIGLMQNS